MRISTVGIVTRGRPELLRACIESHLACARRFGREIDFVVLDDSDDADWRTFLVTRALRRHGVRVRWIGNVARAVLVDCLVANGASRAAAKLAVTRTSRTANMTGAARNALLLMTVGERIVLSDDDITCAPDRPCDERDLSMWASSGADDPTHTKLLACEQDVAPGRDDVDVLGAYERLLSQDPVMCAMPGLRGASGMGLPYLRLLGARSSADASLVGSDLVHRAPRRTTVTRGPYGFGAHVAADNRLPLPPFAPDGRNQDGVFFALRCRLFPRSVAAVLPLTLRHAPPRPRSRAEIVASAGVVRANDFVVDRVLRLPVESRGATMDGRAAVLGEHLRAFVSAETFEATYVEWIRTAHAEQRDRADSLLASVDRQHTPPEVVADLREIRATLAHVASSTTVDRELVEAARAQIARVGGLLVHWQSLRVAAARASGPRRPWSPDTRSGLAMENVRLGLGELPR